MTADRLTHWEGEPVSIWARLWGVPVVEAWGRIGSTSDRARALAEDAGDSFSVVLAEEQCEGRGRGGRAWYSPYGSGLWMSVLVRSVGSPAPLVPLLAGVAVCRSLRVVAPSLEPKIKWPNDVFVSQKKVCGILCEASGDHVVIGIGVNVFATPFPPDLRGRATSIESEEGRRPARADLAGGIVGQLRRLLGDVGQSLDPETLRELSSLDYLGGTTVKVWGGVEGVASGIQADGSLRISRTDGHGIEMVTAGSIEIVNG